MKNRLSIAAAFLFLSMGAYAGEASTCFNFDQPVTAPLKPAVAWKGGKDATASGKTKDFIWGSARGEVDKPVKALYQQLLDHFTIKDKKQVKLKVYDQPRKGYENFHLVMISLELPVTTVDWEEDWAYDISNGTAKDPKEVVISYQKTNGSTYIPHLCGSIVLKKISDTKTDVYFYEEVNALGKRSPEATVKGHLGTLATLRGQTGT